MEINISGAALVRLALWLAVAAVVIGMVIGAKTSADPAPASNVHPADPPGVEAAND